MRSFPYRPALALCAAGTIAALSLARPLGAAPAARAPVTAPIGSGMVAAANPMAVEAGLIVLREGGGAADAAVAVQAALGLVEPQSSGLGGGAFMTYYDASTKTVTAYDGRETAPAAATPALFTGMTMGQAVTSGRSTGTPGVVAMLALVHQQHGKRPWGSLFGETIRLAEEGFPAPPRLAANAVSAGKTPALAAFLTMQDGRRLQAGETFRNPAYGAVLRRLARDGAGAMYSGPLAQAMVDKVSANAIPGQLSLADLSAYRPRSAPALCRPYRIYIVCVPPPPSSGVAILQGLMLLEKTDIATRGPADPLAWVQLAEAQRLLYADRDRYVADPAFTPVPVEGLLESAYIERRSALMTGRMGAAPSPGQPPGALAMGPDATAEVAGTSHFVVVDKAGNVASVTTSVESSFGSGALVEGFFLNNQLTDFSFSPAEADGRPIANAVAGGKRPRSSMSPVIVLDRDNNFVAAVGSPGGHAILAYNLKALVALLDWKLPVSEALALPNLMARGAAVSGEQARFAPGVVSGMAGRGLELGAGRGAEGSGLHAVMVRNGVLEGAADDRRDGIAKAP